MTLFLEKRGCDFFKDDRINQLSDVGNYRVGSYNYSIEGKDGINYILEFTNWKRYKYRKTHKRTGKPLKHEIKEIFNENALHIDTEYENENGCFRNCKLENIIYEMNLNFTINDILKAVNLISKDKYTDIKFI